MKIDAGDARRPRNIFAVFSSLSESLVDARVDGSYWTDAARALPLAASRIWRPRAIANLGDTALPTCEWMCQGKTCLAVDGTGTRTRGGWALQSILASTSTCLYRA